jgi:hypothetical protein
MFSFAEQSKKYWLKRTLKMGNQKYKNGQAIFIGLSNWVF